MTGMKQCTCCKDFKGVESYRKSASKSHTYEYRCNVCLEKFGRARVNIDIHGKRYAVGNKRKTV